MMKQWSNNITFGLPIEEESERLIRVPAPDKQREAPPVIEPEPEKVEQPA